MSSVSNSQKSSAVKRKVAGGTVLFTPKLYSRDFIVSPRAGKAGQRDYLLHKGEK